MKKTKRLLVSVQSNLFHPPPVAPEWMSLDAEIRTEVTELLAGLMREYSRYTTDSLEVPND